MMIASDNPSVRMRVHHGEKLWYKRHPVIDGTRHVGWLNGTIDQDTTFFFYEDPHLAPVAADFVDADGNVLDREQFLADWDAEQAAKAEVAEAAAEAEAEVETPQPKATRKKAARKATAKKAAVLADEEVPDGEGDDPNLFPADGGA